MTDNGRMGLQVEIKGALEVERGMRQVIDDLHGPEMVRAMRTAANMVATEAKANAPVDTGRLRGSITPVIRVDGATVVGVVGTNVSYAPYMEFGTGTYAGRPPHFPPPSALDRWARRHGFGSGYEVAMAIYKKGGLEPREYLQRAYRDNEGRIQSMIEGAVAKIVREF